MKVNLLTYMTLAGCMTGVVICITVTPEMFSKAPLASLQFMSGIILFFGLLMVSVLESVRILKDRMVDMTRDTAESRRESRRLASQFEEEQDRRRAAEWQRRMNQQFSPDEH